MSVRPFLCLAAALACATILAAAPAHAHDAAIPAHAAHEWGAGSLAIHFREAIDPASLDLAKMDLVACSGDSGCAGMPLAGQHIIWAGDRGSFPGMAFRITLSGDANAALLSAATATLEFGEGAYLDSGGRPNAAGHIPVLVAWESLPQLLWRVEYHDHRNELVLHFHEAVEPASIDEGLLRITTDPAKEEEGVLFTLSGLEPVRVAGGGVMIVYELRPDDRDGLLPVLSSYRQDWQEYYERWLDGSNIVPSGSVVLTVGREAYTRAHDGMPTNYDSEVIAIQNGTGLLEYAVYGTADNRLVLYFAEEIDPFQIRTHRMHVSDDAFNVETGHLDRFDYHAGIHTATAHSNATLSPSEIARVGPDRLSVAFELSERNRYHLSWMAEPVILLEQGAVRPAADADGTAAQHMPLEVRGPPAFPLDPDVAAGLLVGRVEYGGENGRITLHFREPVEPSSVDAARISIRHDPYCAEVALRDGDLVGVAGDGLSATFVVGGLRNGILRAMTDAWMHLEEGAFLAAAGGTASEAGRVPFPDDPDRYSGGSRTLEFARMWLPCHITYGIEPPDSILRYYGFDPAQHREAIIGAVDDGIGIWAELNPGITVERIAGGEPDLTVRWLHANASAGGYSCGCLGPGAYIEILLVAPSDLEGAHPYWVSNIWGLRDAAAHEFGHTLGLGHHKDPGHLMAGVTGVQDPYKDLGLNIPDRYWWRAPGG